MQRYLLLLLIGACSVLQPGDGEVTITNHSSDPEIEVSLRLDEQRYSLTLRQNESERVHFTIPSRDTGYRITAHVNGSDITKYIGYLSPSLLRVNDGLEVVDHDVKFSAIASSASQ
jgi:hypothetical protein